MNKGIIFGSLAAIAITASIYWAYQAGRSSMRNEMIALPGIPDTSQIATISPSIPDTMQGSPAIPENRHRIDSAGRSPSSRSARTLTTEIIEGVLDGGDSRHVFRDTLLDTKGGEHAIRFDYPEGIFTERYQSPPDTSVSRIVTLTKYVPVGPPDFWMQAVASWRAGGAIIGFKSIGVGRIWSPTFEPVTVITFTHYF